MSLTLDPHLLQPHALASVVPAPGPAWYGSVMGTGILATLLQLNADRLPLAHDAAAGLLVVGWLLLVTLSAGFARRAATDRRVLVDTITERAGQTHWGMVAMGLLATGSATLTVLPSVVPSAGRLALVVDVVLWTAGTLLGVVTTLGFTAGLIRRGGVPGFGWGLPVVPPMVSATTGAALVPHVHGTAGRLALLVACAACFVISLAIGAVVFAVAYHHHLRVETVAIGASASAWIPLGVVGQSTAAAQAIAAQATSMMAPGLHSDLRLLADAYGVVMLAIAVPLVAYAVRVTARGFTARMPFAPGWWALTFPIGTLALGAHLLGARPGLAAYEVVGLVLVVVLCLTWTLCAVASVRAVASRNPVVPERTAA